MHKARQHQAGNGSARNRGSATLAAIAERLRAARQQAGYGSGSDAARAQGLVVSTYLAHENGSRGISTGAGRRYAEAFGVSLAWLLAGEGAALEPAVPAQDRTSAPIPMVGYVGAGAEVYPIDDHMPGLGLDEVDPPPGADQPMVAVTVRGQSMYPRYFDGDMLFYSRSLAFDETRCINNECVCKVENGPTLIKIIRRGTSQYRYTLESFNAPPIEDVRIEWAAPVDFVDRRRSRRKG